MDSIVVLRRVKTTHEDLYSGAILKLLQLVRALEEYAPSLNFVHLTNEWHSVVDVRIEWVASEIEESL